MEKRNKVKLHQRRSLVSQEFQAVFGLQNPEKSN